MSDQTFENEVDEAGEFEATRRRGPSGRKLILFILLPLLLLGGAVGGLYATGVLQQQILPLVGFGGSDTLVAEEEETGPSGPVVFLEVPTMLVNLNSSGRQTNFLKLTVRLELASAEDAQRLESVMPRVIDNFQVYLRELRMEDLRGSAGLQRLREELLLRVNAAAEGARVRDVLFEEMLVQ